MVKAIHYQNPIPIHNKNADVKICIIGAGVSGICTLKNLKEYGFKNVKVFEEHDKMGGIWAYHPNPSFPNAMYPSLHTNFPISFMKYPDYSFPKNTELYPPYTKVYQYMQSYINQFKLNQHIQCNHKIIKVEPIDEINKFINMNINKWNVKYIINNDNNKIYQEIFDFVLICNGHFRHCRFPKHIAGFDELSIPYIHSRSYRGFDDIKSYKNRNILLIGSGNTASDIIEELVINKVCHKIYHSTSIWKFALK